MCATKITSPESPSFTTFSIGTESIFRDILIASVLFENVRVSGFDTTLNVDKLSARDNFMTYRGPGVNQQSGMTGSGNQMRTVQSPSCFDLADRSMFDRHDVTSTGISYLLMLFAFFWYVVIFAGRVVSTLSLFIY